ncbi:MAG: glycosyltransferase [Acidimicrobiales bacterium]
MVPLSPADLSVVIPTFSRWSILERTLEGLRAQTVSGFEIVVVVDGDDQAPPELDGTTVLVQRHAGPGAARNRGVRASRRPLVLFLGDDMIPAPDLVARHLAVHDRHPEPEVAVLGHARWHRDVAHQRVHRWIDFSGTQFDFPDDADADAGFGRFVSCNVSLKRSFFLDAGGFDETFTYYYEDLDCAYRLDKHGMRLVYEPRAVTEHLHAYDLPALEQRMRGVAVGERLMAQRHSWFTPHFLGRFLRARDAKAVSRLWPAIVDAVPRRPAALRRRFEDRATRWYDRRLAESFLAAWLGEEDLDELKEYLGDRFDERLLYGHAPAVDAERDAAPDEATFYRTSQSYLYDLTAFASWGTKAPYLADLRALVPAPARLLDYGCGIGADGLRLTAAGYHVSYADFANPSTSYLRWRLQRRGLDAPVYDVEADEIPGDFDAAFSFDVIEHVEDPFGFLDALERRAGVVMVNLLDEDDHDTDLHKPLPVAAILERAARRGLLRYRRYHGRSHLVAYRGTAAGPGRIASEVERRLGRYLPGRPGWFPIPER